MDLDQMKQIVADGTFNRSNDPKSADGKSQRKHTHTLSSQGPTKLDGSNASKKEWGQLGLKTYEMQILLSSTGSQKSHLNKDSKTNFEPVKTTAITKGEHVIASGKKSAAILPNKDN